MTETVQGQPPVGAESAAAPSSPEALPATPEEVARLRAKLDLVTEDKRRAGEKNAELNRRLQELEESLKATQVQLKTGEQSKLAESGEYKKLWEDAKETNLQLERQLSDLRAELDAERQARNTESLRSRALSEISAAKALRPDQLLALLGNDLREVEGQPVVIAGGIEVPLADHLARLRAQDSGWEHHFAPVGARGMGSAPATPSGGIAGIKNPFAAETFNLTEQARLYKSDPELFAKLKAAAGK